MGLECTPENLVTALRAKLNQNSITKLVIIVLFFCYCIPDGGASIFIRLLILLRLHHQAIFDNGLLLIICFCYFI